MYLYLRSDLPTTDLPPPLLAKVGRLTPVMNLELSPARRLARVDVLRVIEAIGSSGYFLQLPPNGAVNARLNFGGG